MLRKKEVYTIITPIPSYIPRQLALDILHSHSEVITLNPLVLNHYPIAAPRHAQSDEFYSTWYEIVERIQFVPGVGKVGSGQISFSGCFHDMPWGLQTHIYAPMNIDLRHKYRIGGNQPGVEPAEPREIGTDQLGIPADGLYLREDIEIRCNFTMVGFVKTQTKAASKEMIARIIKKAELLDAGVLSAMIQDGRLRTVNPNDRSKIPTVPSPNLTTTESTTSSWEPNSPQVNPGYMQHQQQGGLPAYQYDRPESMVHPTPSPGPQPYQVPRSPPPRSNTVMSNMGMVKDHGPVSVELPAQNYFPQQQQQQPQQYQQQQQGGNYYDPNHPHRPSVGSVGSHQSSHSAQQSFMAELPATNEVPEERRGQMMRG